MVEPITQFPIRRYREGRLAASQDRVAMEESLEIRLLGESFQVLMPLPGWEKELAIWKTAGLDPQGQKWYLEVGQGMGKTQRRQRMT